LKNRSSISKFWEKKPAKTLLFFSPFEKIKKCNRQKDNLLENPGSRLEPLCHKISFDRLHIWFICLKYNLSKVKVAKKSNIRTSKVFIWSLVSNDSYLQNMIQIKQNYLSFQNSFNLTIDLCKIYNTRYKSSGQKEKITKLQFLSKEKWHIDINTNHCSLYIHENYNAKNSLGHTKIYSFADQIKNSFLKTQNFFSESIKFYQNTKEMWGLYKQNQFRLI